MRIDWPNVIGTARAGMRRNVAPGLALQAFALALLAAYYLAPAARPAFATVAAWKTRYGLVYSAGATALFGGLIPFLYLLAARQVRPEQRGRELLFYMAFWGYRGIEVDLFYRLQAFLFGGGATLGVVLPKVLVDQFVYSVFVAAPGQVVAFLWKDRGFSWRACRPDLNLGALTGAVVRVTFSQWMIWIPAVSIIYCLPSALQIPLFNLVVCFWVLLLTFVARGQGASGGR